MSGSRTLAIVAAISIAVNLLVIGAFAGMALRPGPPPVDAPPRNTEDAIARTILENSPAEDRRAVRTQLRRTWQTARPLREQLETARADARAALIADPYDVDAAAEALTALSQAEADLRQSIQRDLAERLATVSPDTRERLAEGLMRPRGRRDDQRRRGRFRDRQRPQP